MTKGKKSGGDYEGWILRLIDKAEDLLYSFNVKKWLDFAESKITPLQGYHLTRQQAAVLEDKRSIIQEIFPQKLGVDPEFTTRYRSLSTGRFTKDPTNARPEETVRFRDLETGTMTSRKTLNANIQSLKTSKEWAKV